MKKLLGFLLLSVYLIVNSQVAKASNCDEFPNDDSQSKIRLCAGDRAYTDTNDRRLNNSLVHVVGTRLVGDFVSVSTGARSSSFERLDYRLYYEDIYKVHGCIREFCVGDEVFVNDDEMIQLNGRYIKSDHRGIILGINTATNRVFVGKRYIKRSYPINRLGSTKLCISDICKGSIGFLLEQDTPVKVVVKATDGKHTIFTDSGIINDIQFTKSDKVADCIDFNGAKLCTGDRVYTMGQVLNRSRISEIVKSVSKGDQVITTTRNPNIEYRLSEIFLDYGCVEDFCTRTNFIDKKRVSTGDSSNTDFFSLGTGMGGSIVGVQDNRLEVRYKHDLINPEGCFQGFCVQDTVVLEQSSFPVGDYSSFIVSGFERELNFIIISSQWDNSLMRVKPSRLRKVN